MEGFCRDSYVYSSTLDSRYSYVTLEIMIGTLDTGTVLRSSINHQHITIPVT